MRLIYHLLALLAALGWSALSRTLVRMLSKCWLVTPPWCLKKILFADLDRYKTPEARATIVLASKLYGLDPEDAAKLLHCEQITGLLKVSVPSVAGANLIADPKKSKQPAYTPRLNYDHILIFSYGRTGSTLLMGLLNSIPGVLIRGENYNAFYHLFQYFDALSRTRSDHPKANKTTQPWFGAADLKLRYMLADLRRVARETLLGQVEHREQIRCLGFKEIRYSEAADHFDEYVGFLEDIFPNALFIINRRDHREVARSGFWNDVPYEEALAELHEIEKLFGRLPTLHSQTFELDYSDISLESGRLKMLFETIGAPFSPNLVEEVLGEVHSYTPNQQQIQDLARDADRQ
jgi:hypothetical protein